MEMGNPDELTSWRGFWTKTDEGKSGRRAQTYLWATRGIWQGRNVGWKEGKEENGIEKCTEMVESKEDSAEDRVRRAWHHGIRRSIFPSQVGPV
jgi:hypothetical protein